MIRREFLQVAAGVAVAACARPVTTTSSPAPPSGARKIRGICFDLFTLFDPRSVVTVAQSIIGDAAAGFCELWRARQFQYAFLRSAAGQYEDFRRITDDALLFAARSGGVTLSGADRARLVGAYSELAPWPDAREALTAFRAKGLKLAPLANYSPSMLDGLLDHAGLGDLFDARISTDAARTFKPDPRAYALGVSTLGLAREEIAFAAFGGWDAAGARWFGYHTFWVNRLGVPAEELPPGPHATGPTLAELAAFVDSSRP